MTGGVAGYYTPYVPDTKPKGDTSVHDATVTDPNITSDTGYDDDQGSQFSGPKVGSWTPGSADNIKVDAGAMRTVAGNLRALVTTLKSADKRMTGLVVAPGGFPHAQALSSKVVGAGSDGATVSSTAAQPLVQNFIAKAVDALTTIAADLEKIAAEYEKTEDDNKVDARRIGELLDDAQGYVSKLTGSAVVPDLSGAGTGSG